MNRAQRRQANKATPAYKRGKTQEERMAALYRNGITADDLRKAEQANYAAGWRDACDYAMKVCYAAAVLALRDLEGYGARRNQRFLHLMDDKVVTTLSSEDAIQEAFDRAGVAIDFRDPIHRVGEREESA